MLVPLILGLALLQPQQGTTATDTTVAVQAGTRLTLALSSGEVRIRTWDRNQVRIQAEHSTRTTVTVRTEGAVVRIDAQGRMGLPSVTDFILTVPVWMPAELDGMNLDVDAEGMRGALQVGGLNGDVTVRDGADLDLSVMNGDLVIEGARGRVTLSTVAGRITGTGIQGEVSADAVSGGIGLYRIESGRVAAETVSGEVLYQGTVRDGGSYTLATHSGSVTFGMPATANATVNSATTTGTLSASFDLPAVEERSRSRRAVRLGTGSATVDLETFSGSIRLVRPNEVPAAPARRERHDGDFDAAGWTGGLDHSLEILDHLDLGGLAGLAGLVARGEVGVRMGEFAPRFNFHWNHDLDLNVVPDIKLELPPRRDRSATRPPFDRQER